MGIDITAAGKSERGGGLEWETVTGQIVAKANHYVAVPDKANGGRRIIKDQSIRAYERAFARQCTVYAGRRIASRFRLFVKVYHRSERFDLDNSLKTLLDCLQAVGAISDDKLCFAIMAEKYIDRYCPRVEFAIVEMYSQQDLFHV